MKKRILVLSMLVALVGVLVVPMAALAVGPDTAVSGTMPATTLEVTAPLLITLGSLYGSTGNITGASSTNGTVLSLMNPSGYTLKIASNKSNGKMASGTDNLTNVLGVTPTLGLGTGGDITNAGLVDVTVTTDTQNVGTGASSPTETGTNSIALSVNQAKQITGVGGATYTITLTFTAEPIT